jgi:GDP-D-mannose dehydratase
MPHGVIKFLAELTGSLLICIATYFVGNYMLVQHEKAKTEDKVVASTVVASVQKPVTSATKVAVKKHPVKVKEKKKMVATSKSVSTPVDADRKAFEDMTKETPESNSLASFAKEK